MGHAMARHRACFRTERLMACLGVNTSLELPEVAGMTPRPASASTEEATAGCSLHAGLRCVERGRCELPRTRPSGPEPNESWR